jgi:hypothetical protein
LLSFDRRQIIGSGGKMPQQEEEQSCHDDLLLLNKLFDSAGFKKVTSKKIHKTKAKEKQYFFLYPRPRLSLPLNGHLEWVDSLLRRGGTTSIFSIDFKSG